MNEHHRTLGRGEGNRAPRDGSRSGSPRDHLLALWRYRYRILFATILAGVIAFTVSMLMEPVYQARSTLILRPARFSTDLKPIPLSVESYRAILSSDFIRQKLREEAERRGIVSGNGQSWSTTVDIYQEKATSRPGERAFIPLIDLIVEASEPQLATQIANIWAEVFIRENNDLTAEVKSETVAFIEAQFPTVSASLEEQEQSLKEREDYFNSGKVELENQWSQRTLDTRLEQATRKTEFDNETERLKTEYSNETERMRTEYERETETLRSELESRSQPDLLKAEARVKEEKLSSFRDSELDTSLAIEGQTKTLEELKAQIESQPPLLTLSKAIDDEALWDRIGRADSARALEELKKLKLESESLNPIYQELLSRLITAQVNVNTLAARRSYLKGEINRLQSEIAELKTTTAEKDLALFTLAKERDLGLRELFEKRRAGLQNLVRNRELERIKLTESADQKLAALTRTKENQLDEFERRRQLELSQMTRKTESLRNTYKVMAEKHESAQLAKAEEESDIKIGARAVVPHRTVSPRPGVNTALALFFGFVISSLLVLGLSYMSEEDPAGTGSSRPASDESPTHASFGVSQPAVRAEK